MSMLRVRRLIWSRFWLYFLVYLKYPVLSSWYGFQRTEFYRVIYRFCIQLSYRVRSAWILDVIKGTVFARSILLVKYIEKYREDGKDISDPKFINHVDRCLMNIQKKILFYSAKGKHQYDLRNLNSWTNLITTEMEEMKTAGEISTSDLLELFTYRLHYLSDRMGFERFIHLQLIWFYTRSRLVYVPSERGSYVEADDSFHPEIIPQWHD